MRALIAEDDPNTRAALSTILKNEGWAVHDFDNGGAALNAFRTSGFFDLVCLDVMMPGLSGYELCKEIRKLDQDVPVVFISAKSEELDSVLGLELGADDFIVKPFGVREVVARINAIRRRSSRVEPSSPSQAKGPPLGSSEAFAFGPWRIVPKELRAYGDTERLDLSSREMTMVQLLASRPGEVIDRATFFRECWGFENPPASRTLDQHMVGLRKKLDPDSRLIHTVQGAGYRYEAN